MPTAARRPLVSAGCWLRPVRSDSTLCGRFTSRNPCTGFEPVFIADLLRTSREARHPQNLAFRTGKICTPLPGFPELAGPIGLSCILPLCDSGRLFVSTHSQQVQAIVRMPAQLSPCYSRAEHAWPEIPTFLPGRLALYQHARRRCCGGMLLASASGIGFAVTSWPGKRANRRCRHSSAQRAPCGLCRRTSPIVETLAGTGLCKNVALASSLV